MSALDNDPLEWYDVDVGFEDEGLEDNRFKLGVVLFDFFEPASDNMRLEEGSDDEVVLSRSICFHLEEEVVLIAVDVKSTSIGSSWLPLMSLASWYDLIPFHFRILVFLLQR